MKVIPLLILFASLLASPIAHAQTDQINGPGIGGNSMTALLVENQKELKRDLAKKAGIDWSQADQNPIEFYRTVYEKTGGGPTLQWLGVPLSKISQTVSIQNLYWTLITIAGAYVAVLSMAAASSGASDAAVKLGGWILKLLVGVIIVANASTFYALAMTLRDSLVYGVGAIVSPVANQDEKGDLQKGLEGSNLAAINIDQIRTRSIEKAIVGRMAITQSFDESADGEKERKEFGKAMNAIATTLNNKFGKQRVPVFTDDVLNDRGAHLQGLADQFRGVVFGLSSVKDESSLATSYNGLAVHVIGNFLLDEQNPRSPEFLKQEILSTPQTPDNRDTIDTKIQQFEGDVFRYVQTSIDNTVRNIKGHSPVNMFGAWGDAFDRAAEFVTTGPMDYIQNFLRVIIEGVQRCMAYIIARGANLVLNLIVELNVFLIILCMPLWLIPATPKAYPALWRALMNTTLFLPVFQFLMVIVDCIYAKILGAVSVGVAVAGVAAIATGPLPALGLMLGYIVAYAVTVILLLKNTPKIIASLINGAGAASAFVGTMATGLAAGGLVAAGIVAAPAVGSALAGSAGAAGGALKTAGTAAGSKISGMIPAGVKAAASNAMQSASNAAQAVANSRAGQVTSSAARQMATYRNARKPAAPAAPIPGGSGPAPAPAMASAPAPAPAVAAEQKKKLESFENPVRFALKTAGREVVAAAASEDVGSYLSRRGG